MIKSCPPHRHTIGRHYSHVMDETMEALAVQPLPLSCLPNPHPWSGLHLSVSPPSAFLPVSLPSSHPQFPLSPTPPHPPAEALPGSPFRARIPLMPQKGAGFCRPKARMGRMQMSLCTSFPHCFWSAGSGRGHPSCQSWGYWGWLCNLVGRII